MRVTKYSINPVEDSTLGKLNASIEGVCEVALEDSRTNAEIRIVKDFTETNEISLTVKLNQAAAGRVLYDLKVIDAQHVEKWSITAANGWTTLFVRGNFLPQFYSVLETLMSDKELKTMKIFLESTKLQVVNSHTLWQPRSPALSQDGTTHRHIK